MPNDFNDLNAPNRNDINPLAAMMSDSEPKKLTGRNEEDCKRMLFNMFGSRYQIIGARTILKGGLFGFGQKEYCEVRYIVKPGPLSSSESFDKNRQELIDKITGGPGNALSLKQLAAIDKKLEELQDSVNSKLSSLSVAASSSEHQSIQKIENLLIQNEFSLSYINDIKNRLKGELSVEQLDDFEFVQRTVVDWIGKSIAIYPETKRRAPHVIILVGPTGVGKTTTIAKLAGTLLKNANLKKQPKPAIRMITIDHTRVGAEEQLRRFGVLMDVAVDKAESAADVKQIFDTYRNSLDVLFIDTPGYSPNDFESIGKMRGILEIPGMNKDVYLTITASVKARDLVSIIQVYEQFKYDSVIITKCDETTAFGNVLSVLSEKHKPIAYITDGQQVPKKIERASVVKFLTNLNDFQIDRNHIEEVFSEKSES